MSVIYLNVEKLEALNRQQMKANSAQLEFEIAQQFIALKRQVDMDMSPYLRLCAPWTYVGAAPSF